MFSKIPEYTLPNMNSIKLVNAQFLANFILKNKNKVKGWTKEPANFLLKRMLVNSKGQHSWLEMVPDEASFTNLDLSFFLSS